MEMFFNKYFNMIMEEFLPQQEIKKRARGRPRSNKAQVTPNIVLALDRGLNILLALADEGSITLSDMSLKTGIPPSSAHRILVTLQKHGFVEFDEIDQKWSVGVEAFRVGSAYLVGTNLVEASHKIMRELMQETGETANLAIADGADVVFISQVETHNPIRAFFRPGTRGAIYASGIGKALLCQMERKNIEKLLRNNGLKKFTPNTLTSPDELFTNLTITKQRGFSLDDEEQYLGMRCVAAPIYNSFGEAIAGISISGPIIRFDNNQVLEFGPIVKRAANKITKIIGGKPPRT